MSRPSRRVWKTLARWCSRRRSCSGRSSINTTCPSPSLPWPADQRRIVEGYYFRQLGVDGIAAESHRTIDAVYKAIQRIRRLLQDCIERAERAEAVA